MNKQGFEIQDGRKHCPHCLGSGALSKPNQKNQEFMKLKCGKIDGVDMYHHFIKNKCTKCGKIVSLKNQEEIMKKEEIDKYVDSVMTEFDEFFCDFGEFQECQIKLVERLAYRQLGIKQFIAANIRKALSSPLSKDL